MNPRKLKQTKGKISAKNRVDEKNRAEMYGELDVLLPNSDNKSKSLFSKPFLKKQLEKIICRQLKSAGEFLMKGKSMSEEEAAPTFFSSLSALELCILELCESYCEKKAKEHQLNENEQINEAVFCSQAHIQPLILHSHTNKTVQKHL